MNLRHRFRNKSATAIASVLRCFTKTSSTLHTVLRRFGVSLYTKDVIGLTIPQQKIHSVYLSTRTGTRTGTGTGTYLSGIIAQPIHWPSHLTSAACTTALDIAIAKTTGWQCVEAREGPTASWKSHQAPGLYSLHILTIYRRKPRSHFSIRWKDRELNHRMPQL